MTDLAKLAAKSTIEIWLDSPIDGTKLDNPDGSPMTITAHTSDSTEFRAVVAELRKSATTDTDPASFANALLARAVVSVNLIKDGKPVKLNDMASLLSDPGFTWVRDQIDKAIMDRTRFFG